MGHNPFTLFFYVGYKPTHCRQDGGVQLFENSLISFFSVAYQNK